MSDIITKLTEWRDKDLISQLELEYVRFLQQLEEHIPDEVLLASAACIHAQRNGHLCLELTGDHSDKPNYLFEEEQTDYPFKPDVRQKWIKQLEASSLVSKNGELKPLVLDKGRLYLHKYWKFEEEFCDWVNQKSSVQHAITEDEIHVLKELLPPPKDLFDINWQDIAVILSFLKDVVFITGGPGTGKTHTVLSIIAAHAFLNREESFRIAMAAPTGKAARRMMESVEQGRHNLPPKFQDQLELPENALTVHKLLGADYRGHTFRYNEQNPLPFDLVVIDEASMLDINLWVRLTRAIAPKTKLIVLGDKDQLASVEAGSILGDICQGENRFSKSVLSAVQKVKGIELEVDEGKPAINDCVVFLTKSYRFDEKSGIQRISQAVNNSNADEVLEVLNSSSYPDVQWLPNTPENLQQAEQQFGVRHYLEYADKLNLDEMQNASTHKKILCAVRKSPSGVEEINKRVELGIKRTLGRLQQENWYHGRQVMATKNDTITKIRNGEIGIYNQSTETIFFEGEFKTELTPARLQHFEPAFAITIHKSQGSEFDEVSIVLPNRINTILSKEILYTSVTRARQSTLVIANEEILRYTINRSIKRDSGVRDKIWGNKE